MSKIPKNGTVKWAPLLYILIPIVLGLCSYTYSVSSDSIERDKDSFRKDEHLQFEKRMDDRFNHSNDKIDGLNVSIRELNMEFKEGMKSLTQDIKELKTP